MQQTLCPKVFKFSKWNLNYSLVAALNYFFVKLGDFISNPNILSNYTTVIYFLQQIEMLYRVLESFYHLNAPWIS